MKKILPSLLLAVSLFGVTLQEINDSPTCRAKDFMIWQYLKQDITPKEASDAFYQVTYVTNRFLHSYAKKCDDDGLKYASKCMRLPFNKLLAQTDNKCMLLALSPYKVSKLSSSDKHKLLNKDIDEDIKSYIRFMDDTISFTHIKKFSPKTFLRVFNSAGREYRHNNFNLALPSLYINSLTHSYSFSRLVKSTVSDPKLSKLQDSLLHVDTNATFKPQTHFFLAMNHLKHSQEDKALIHLQKVYDKSYFRMDKDKARFWQYQITKDDATLSRLAESVDINIYSMYAKELKKVAIENYFTTMNYDTNVSAKNLQNPFVWNKVLKEIKSTKKDDLLYLSEKFKNPNNVQVQAFIKERASGYIEHNYIMPYSKSMRFYSNDDVALMYALMRQESRFIPSALSRSYALGVMQLMPFLVDVLDKSFEDRISSYNDMFNPDRNIKYSYKHIKSLQKSMYHPLFIAYSYNGGMGFFRRHLKSTGAFSEGKYEPFISLELMSNSESREYGKKVLANYVMYKHILKEDVSILVLFDMLTQPRLTDRFRALALR